MLKIVFLSRVLPILIKWRSFKISVFSMIRCMFMCIAFHVEKTVIENRIANNIWNAFFVLKGTFFCLRFVRFITSCPSFQNPEPDAFAFDKYYFRKKWFPFGNIILFWEIWPSRKQSSPVFCQVLLQFRKPTFLIQQPQYILIPIFETEAQKIESIYWQA